MQIEDGGVDGLERTRLRKSLRRKGSELVYLLSLVAWLTFLGLPGTLPEEPDLAPLIVAVTSQGPEMDSQVSPRFGQSAYLTIVDVRSPSVQSVERLDPSRAGFELADELINFKVDVVITGKIGPNALGVLRAAEVRVIQGVSATVEEALKRFEAGDFE